MIFEGLGELLAERTGRINLSVGHDAGQCNCCFALSVEFDLSVFSAPWVGELPESAHTMGYHVLAIRYGAVLFGGAMAALVVHFYRLCIPDVN